MDNKERSNRADELAKRSLEDLRDFCIAFRDYYHQCGSGNGMDFTHELVKTVENVSDIVKTVEKIHTRVKRNLTERQEYVSVPRRNIK